MPRTRLLFPLLALAAAAVAQPWPMDLGYPGRFSMLRAGNERRYAANLTYTLDLEKVLKLHCIVPQRNGDVFGKPIYAGSLAVCGPDGKWSFELPESQRVASVTWPEPNRAVVIQDVRAEQWGVQMAAEMLADQPAIVLRLTRTAGRAPLKLGLLGFGWAERRTALQWRADLADVARTAGTQTALPSAKSFTTMDPGGFSEVVACDIAAQSAMVDDDGLYLTFPDGANGAAVTVSLVPGARAGVLPAASGPLTTTFGGPVLAPWLELAGAGAGGLMLPPTGAFSDNSLLVDTASGRRGLVMAARWRVPLEYPSEMTRSLPEFKPLSPADADRLAAQVKAVLAHQRPDGTFPFNLGRAFHEGMTLSVLAEVAPLLPAELQTEVRAAVKKGLDWQWDHFQSGTAWPGVLTPPEQKGYYDGCVDYPELVACDLQALLRYAARWDKQEAVRRWPDVARQMTQLRWFMDPSGIALAAPGPAYCHVIAESAIGGYLAWQAIYHLAMLADRPIEAAEARARAALAWQAWLAVFAWRPEFGEPPAVVNGVMDSAVQVDRKEPWAYVQSCWFSHMPGFALPHEDTLGVWRSLRAQPWWEWTGRLKSTQRAYDAAVATALVRAGYGEEARAHWTEILARPYTWNSFDEAPVLELAATAWLGQP